MQATSTNNNNINNNNNKNMNGKQQINTAESKPKTSSKPSQFSNKVITKDDIMLLSRGKGSHAHHQSHNVNISNEGVNNDGNDDASNDNINNNNNSKNVILPPKSVIVDSIPASESNFSDSETVQSQDSDILFSPLYDSFQRDEFYEQEMYNDDINNNNYNNSNSEDDDDFSSSLRKFKNYQMVPTSDNMFASNITDLALPFGIQDEIKDTDFWKEVKGTNEDIIPFNNINTDDIRSKRRLSMVSQHMANATMEDFVSDDLLATSSTTGNTTNNNTPISTDMSQYNIKLLCYRDADGKLALRTTNQNKRNNYSLSGPTGLVRRKRTNKKKNMLKKAIRRKSGVLEMISTGVKMNEFML
ncbi:hypothetical protein MOSE0_M03224 [Monosporozyma servazzii]